MRLPSNRYLFIRLLEACNADCFMCGYALSQDKYRFTLTEFEDLLPKARAVGVGFVRLTGGEPLMHKETIAIVHAGTMAGMKMSIITNGSLLPRKADRLAQAGLAQIIVSIDGATAATHDSYRNTQGLFDKAIEGLYMAHERGILTRVNTVVGPHNYEEMPQLQRLLTECKVRQWELSAIKLERPIAYPDPDRVRSICDALYEADPDAAPVPMGKRFYGETAAEQQRFFNSGIMPRPSPPQCHLAGDVIYLDAKAGRGFACSLLPHRRDRESGGGVLLRNESGWELDSEEFREHVRYFRDAGPSICSGCSTTAAGYSDRAAAVPAMADWSF
jgi:cytosylglucuronate decarboxylase